MSWKRRFHGCNILVMIEGHHRAALQARIKADRARGVRSTMSGLVRAALEETLAAEIASLPTGLEGLEDGEGFGAELLDFSKNS